MAVIGILTAVISRNTTGKGQFVDISMLDGTVSWLQTLLPNYLVNQELPKKGELALSGSKACYEVYETSDQRFVSVGALEEKFWIEFCKGIGRVDFIEHLNASQNKQDELKIEIGKIIKTKTMKEWLDIFENYETCISPVLTFEEMTKHPQIRDRGMIQEIPGLDGVHIGIPIKLSETPGSIYSKAPKLGEHNEQIFKELGFKKDKIDSYIQEGII